MAKMKLKRRIRFKFKNIIIIVIMIISFFVGMNAFFKINLYSSNEEFIMELLNDSNHYKKYESKNTLQKIMNNFFNIELDKPTSLLENMFNYKKTESSNPIKLTQYINNPNPADVSNPTVYIYNTHQLENYSNSNYEAYNITPNVMMASYLLRERLNDFGIPTIVEEGNITEFLKINNWDYNYSYQASRYYVEEAIKTHKSLSYFIDLHRDSINKDASTININGQNYAKIMFVVGLEHDNYAKNLDLAKKLNSVLIEKYPGLSRGVIEKSGPTVNGIYNQDLSPNSILLEVGGYQNKIEEVLNTIEALAQVLKEEILEKEKV